MIKYMAILSVFSLSMAVQANCVVIASVECVLEKYGTHILFDVERKGETIGQHQLRFSSVDDALQIDAEMKLEINFLRFFTYRYRYQAIEKWRKGELYSLQVSVDDDGDVTRISAQQGSDFLSVERDGVQDNLPLGLLTTNHWHAGLLDKNQVLNTLTGQVSQVDVVYLGDVMIPVKGSEVRVKAYRLGGELDETVTWYDDQDRWMGMEFSAPDQSRIRLTNPRFGEAYVSSY